MREETLGAAATRSSKGSLDHLAVAGWRVSGKVTELARDNDLVLIDSPPHADTEARFAIAAGDLVLIPVQPSPMDVWASKATVEIAGAERTPAMLVLNRVPPRAKLTDRMIAALEDMATPVAKTRIGNRVALASSMADGLGITEAAPRSTAASEIRALAREAYRRA